MKLDDIGFYTLSDKRAEEINSNSPLHRCELILTNRCNFKCPYCRGLSSNIELSFDEAKRVVDIWSNHGLKNIRFSGGEPTIWKHLPKLVRYTKQLKSIEHIAISTNGSADFSLYKELLDDGVNDFSISLDACCASSGSKMSGGIKGIWKKVVSNIIEISKLAYTTIGIVLTKENIANLINIVDFSHKLGVSDIRIISAAQYGEYMKLAKNITYFPEHPILNYRVNNIKHGKDVRGMSEWDSKHCYLVLDDMAVMGNDHYPCIIYLREQGKAIGTLSEDFRKQRYDWFKNHNCYDDNICKKNCLDVCIDYNNKVMQFQKEKTGLEKIDGTMFDYSTWINGSVHDLIEGDCRYKNLISDQNKISLKKYAVGYCDGGSLICRPKQKETGVMFWKNEYFWFHLRNNEFIEIFGKAIQ
jgi:molybdenum cofactor biosynthesis enzyme MoaA